MFNWIIIVFIVTIFRLHMLCCLRDVEYFALLSRHYLAFCCVYRGYILFCFCLLLFSDVHASLCCHVSVGFSVVLIMTLFVWLMPALF